MLPILTYHSIDSSGSVISTSPERFRNQMQQLARSGCRTISLSEASDCIRAKREFPQKSVVLTFDDGLQSFFDTAFPVLKKHGFSATVFVVTGRCGKDNRWAEQPVGIPVFELMTWDQIRWLSKEGIDFGVHSENHSDLTALSFEKAKQDITNSKRAFTEQLGTKPSFFAYPYGIANEEVRSFVKTEFGGACSTEMGLVTLASDPYFLPRIDMFYFSNNEMLSWIGSSKFSFYVRSRAVLRSIRKAVSFSGH